MVDLQAVYGDKIFDRKLAHKISRFIPIIFAIVLDIAIAVAIVALFEINWSYAFFKILGLIFIVDAVRQIVVNQANFLNYLIVEKKKIASEMKHYLKLFNVNVNWDAISTYEDFLLQSAYNKSFPTDLRILAAINYGTVVMAIKLYPVLDGRFYKVFCQVVPEYIPDDEELISQKNREFLSDEVNVTEDNVTELEGEIAMLKDLKEGKLAHTFTHEDIDERMAIMFSHIKPEKLEEVKRLILDRLSQ